MASLGTRLIETGGRPTGFDYLRVGLSCLVVVIHSVSLCYGSAYADWLYSLPGLHAATMIVLPMFFALSGFLVSEAWSGTGR